MTAGWVRWIDCRDLDWTPTPGRELHRRPNRHRSRGTARLANDAGSSLESPRVPPGRCSALSADASLSVHGPYEAEVGFLSGSRWSACPGVCRRGVLVMLAQ